jgi:hypothetical protein
MAIFRICILVTLLAAATPTLAQNTYKLPPEITPAIRAACESDVRSLCFGFRPTEASVVSCVRKKFSQLGTACQGKLTAAGLMQPDADVRVVHDKVPSTP